MVFRFTYLRVVVIQMINKLKALSKTNKLYFLAVILSLTSTVFGVLREILIIKVLGFSTLNDYLQIYLSLYFSICLLSDPVRLIYLNLISSRHLKQLLICLTVLVAIIAFVLAMGMCLVQPQLQLSLISIAAVNGILGVAAMLIIFHKQRYGAYLSSQLVNVIPNLVLIPAVVVISFLPIASCALYFLLAFFIVHLVQLILLCFIKVEHEDSDKQNMNRADLIICMRHLISIFGEQFFQIGGRLIFLSLGEGFVTLLSLFIKIFTTARYIFVDSYIGPKLHTWSFDYTKDIFHRFLNNQYLNLTITAGIFVICLFDRVDITFMAFQLSAVFIGYFYFATIYRIGYFKINRFYHYSGLISFIGVFDLLFSLFIYLLMHIYHNTHAALYIFSWGIVRFQINLFVLEKYYLKAKESFIDQPVF